MSRANVVPFPSREPARPTPEGSDRLRQALTRLQDALAAQQQAVQGWRASIGELNLGVATLGHSLERYRDCLDGVQSAASDLNGQARTLEVWAEAATLKTGF